ncbi:MAG: sugar ABC transporter substrate-binding protein [Candidatus Limnocylindrales bacterium]
MKAGPVGVAAPLVVLIAAMSIGCAAPQASAAPVALRLQVSLTAEELADFRPALERVDAAHPEFTVALEEVPQGSEVEKVTTQLAADDLPDLLRVQGLNVQQWIRRGAFLDLTSRATTAGLDLTDFYEGPLDQFRFNDGLWGVPDTASPEVVFINRTMFQAAGIDEPTDDWTYDEMRAAAITLTIDEGGRHPGDAGFDPDSIVQWGWNGGITYFWQNALVKARGGDLCANKDCTQMNFTSAANQAALGWWASLVRDDHAALYDPYGGSQTGVEGDPFLSGKAAMGSNGAFAIGQLNAAGSIDYDIIPPLVGVDGQRYTPLSTNGYAISAHSDHPDEAMALLNALVAKDFLETTWAATGHAVPARRSAAAAVIDTDRAPANQEAILTAMESGAVFRPSTAHAFDAYAATAALFTKMNTGELEVDEALLQIEAAANKALEPDRSP